MLGFSIRKLWKRQFALCFATMDTVANLDLVTARTLTDLRQYINSDLAFSELKFWPLYSEIATVKVVIPSGPASYPANIAFSDHLVAKPSKNPLNLATSIGFNDLDPCDGGWSQNPM